MCFPVEFNSRGAGTKTSLSPCPLPNSGGEQWVFIQCQRLTEAESARPGIRTQVFWLQRPCIWLLHSVESPNYKVVYSVALRWFFFILCLNLLLTDFHRISWTYTCLCLFHCGHLCLFLPCDLSLGGGAFLGPPRHPSPAKGGPNCWRHDPQAPRPALACPGSGLCHSLSGVSKGENTRGQAVLWVEGREMDNLFLTWIPFSLFFWLAQGFSLAGEKR